MGLSGDEEEREDEWEDQSKNEGGEGGLCAVSGEPVPRDWLHPGALSLPCCHTAPQCCCGSISGTPSLRTELLAGKHFVRGPEKCALL